MIWEEIRVANIARSTAIGGQVSHSDKKASAPARINRNVPELSRDDVLRIARTMLLIRRFETRTEELFKAGVIKGTAHSSAGQEAIAAGACFPLRRGDFITTHHRGHGHCIAKGADVNGMMAELCGKVGGICGGIGGSMHVADVALNNLGANGIVGASMGLGVGAALAAKKRGEGDAGVAFFGDGGANEGIFHESLNLAALWKLPIVFFCENNLYGMSTPFEEATAGGTVAGRAASYGIPGERIDGNDPVAVYAAVSEALSRARAGEGPTLIEGLTYRHGDHSVRGNLLGYRTDDEVQNWLNEDPLRRLQRRLDEEWDVKENEFKGIESEVADVIEEAIRLAKDQAEPDVESLFGNVYAPRRAPTAPPPAGERAITYVEALREAISQSIEHDENVFLMGEDVGPVGGTFGVTRGLFDRFGPERVMNTPISEGVISGAAVGAALSGHRPIAEIQIFDFVTFMMDPIVNQAAKLRFMLGGKVSAPVVFRGPQGGGIRLAAQHSQSLEAWFAHIPGLTVLAPSTPYDAKGLMIAAIRDDNPVVFLEHKLLYLGGAAPVPEAPYEIEIGKADVKRSGTDITVIATLAMVERALSAAETLARENISVEVIDPRSLRPLDMECFIRSVKKTSRCLVVHEAWRTGGLGGEIAAQINEDAFDWLDAPVERLGALEVPMPYNDRLEREVMPSASAIADAVRRVCYRDASGDGEA